MPTNEGIKYKGGVELANNKSLESVIDKMLKEARADTAKQIFEELDKIFYCGKEWSEIGSDPKYQGQQYESLKEKYGVD